MRNNVRLWVEQYAIIGSKVMRRSEIRPRESTEHRELDDIKAIKGITCDNLFTNFARTRAIPIHSKT